MDLSKLWIEATATTIQKCFHQVGVNEMAAEAKQDDELAQEDEEMIQFAQEVVVEAPETVMENIPTYETLEDGWEEAVLFPPQVEQELDEDEQFERTSYAYGLCYD